MTIHVDLSLPFISKIRKLSHFSLTRPQPLRKTQTSKPTDSGRKGGSSAVQREFYVLKKHNQTISFGMNQGSRNYMDRLRFGKTRKMKSQ